MLKLLVDDCDIIRTSKLLAKYNINAEVETSCITIDGNISEELALKLCEILNIVKISNFYTTLTPSQKSNFTPEEPKKHPPILYKTVKRGEVYLCDFGIPYESEEGKIRYCIVVQNDIGNITSNTTVVIPCTTSHIARNPTQLSFYFRNDNMTNYYRSHVSPKQNTALADQIRAVSKARLIKYLGTLTDEFMNTCINPILEVSLALSSRKKVVSNKPKKVLNSQKKISTQSNIGLNDTQTLLLSYVDRNDLKDIFQTSSTRDEKARKILELFGFDFEKRGVSYLYEAILVAPKKYFNLKTITETVSKSHDSIISSDEIERLIVARVKETLGMKKSPTINFIRLVNLMLNKEENNNEINI